MRKRIPFSKRSSERGVALILTLGILVLVTLLVIAFAVSMRVENSAAKNFNDLVKARLIAQAGVDQAVATIRQATGMRGNNPVSTYVTFPGFICTNTGGNVGFVNLYSQNSVDQTNLNNGYWITQTNGEFGTTSPGGPAGAEIDAGWIYVGQDPSQPLGPNNPIVGRFAYWVDDEASKININTAGTPPAAPTPDYGTSVPSDVDLTMLLPGLNVAAPITAIQSTTGYTTSEEVRRADPSASDYTANQFSMTTYSDDGNYPYYSDDLNVFGRYRLNVSTLNDPRDINGTLNAGVSNALVNLSDIGLKQIYNSSGTFADKYNVAPYPNGLKQVIANIIAYQLDPTVTPPPQDNIANLNLAPTYVGLAKTPYINEIQLAYTYGGSPGAITVQRVVSVELLYPYDTAYTNGTEQIVVTGLPTAGGIFQNTATISVSGFFAGGVLGGTYHVFPSAADPATAATLPTAGVTLTGPVVGATPTQIVYTRQYPIQGTRRLNFAQMNLLTINLDPAATVGTVVYQGAQAGDPCVNEDVNQWQAYPLATYKGTIGSRNVWQSGAIPPGGTASAYPFVADNSKWLLMRGAPMVSVGELGFIHRPEPFKHITLQPQPVAERSATQIPDWGLLDMFTAGTNAVTSRPTFGRININSIINPGGNNPTTRRLVPLKALLNSVITPPDTVAQNIYDDASTTRDNLDIYGMKVGREGVFDTIGEICEVKGVADDSTKQEADKEAIVRRIANLITVRSSSFTVWVLAQSIKQPNNPARVQPIGTLDPTYDLPPTGEVKAQAVVERYENPPGSTPTFRTRYFRYLYN